jgi:hypothetical protein
MTVRCRPDVHNHRHRASFITSTYGAKRPGKPGTAASWPPVSACDRFCGEAWRGAVIAGIVRAEDAGQPKACGSRDCGASDG